MTIPTITGQILLLTTLAFLGLIISRVSPLDKTLSCVIAGLLGGLALPYIGLDTGIRASNIQNLVFYIILPVLVFEAAWHMNPKILKRWLKPIFLLATVGVLITCFLIAIGTYYGINHPIGYPFIAALLTGSILAATDPSSVTATLKRLNAPTDLATIMEGESLFNDATTIVLFSVLVTIATTSTDAANSGYLSMFLTVFFGGIIVGCIAGLIAAILSLLLAEQSTATITLITLAFASYYAAEHIFHVSGIMSVMSAAIISKLLLDEHQDKLLKTIEPTWEWLGTFFTLIIFVLMGLATQVNMFIDQWLAILIVIAVSLIARFISVFTVSSTTRFSTRPIPVGWQIILSWGGIRGTIAVVLVLSLPVSLSYWWTIQSMVFGVVFFSLIAQGLTIGPLIKKYGKAEF